MKRIILIAAAVTAMASCAKNQIVEQAPPEGNSPIGFSAYTGSAATKGLVVGTDELTAVGSAGIGVFAFYQPGVNGEPRNFNSRKYATPNFMYNQQVNCKTTESKFEYSPLKYWPNNTGDQVSFFAYAPYTTDTTWEDLGFSTDVNATKLTTSFPVYTEKAAMKDYLFATPALNKSKQRANASGASPDLITFNFKHVMSKIGINIGSVVDKLTLSPMPFPQPVDGTGTVITIESISFKGIAESYDYTYTIAGGTESWKDEGEQDLVLTSDAGDFRNNTSASWTVEGWLPLLSQEGDPAEDGFLFIAPQDLSTAKMVITYKVATTNIANPADNSTVTNVIEKEIGVNFESGKAYTLNLLIGMKTVELSAEVVDWDPVTDPHQNDVPENPAIAGGGFTVSPVNIGDGGGV